MQSLFFIIAVPSYQEKQVSCYVMLAKITHFTNNEKFQKHYPNSFNCAIKVCTHCQEILIKRQCFNIVISYALQF